MLELENMKMSVFLHVLSFDKRLSFDERLTLSWPGRYRPAGPNPDR